MWDLYEHAMSTYLNSEVSNTLKKYATQGFTLKQVQIILIEDKQKQSYLKKLAQQDSVAQILDSTANKCLIRLGTSKVNHI